MNETYELIQKILGGERDLFRELIHEFGPGIRAYLSAHLQDSHTVDDIAQESFVAAFEKLSTFKADGEFGRWIRGIAHNKMMMHFRATYRKDDVLGRIKTSIADEIDSDLDDQSGSGRAETIEKMRSCIEKLPERILDVIQAKYYNKERVMAIAERLESTVSTISSLLYRGRKLLETCLEGDV